MNMLSHYLIVLILIISFCSDTNSALTTAQLEKKINTSLKKMHDDNALAIVKMEKKYQELKSQSTKSVTQCINNIKMVASVVNDQEAEISSLRALLKKEDQKIDQIVQDLPIGFVYTELPSTKPATTLWPYFKWKDITNGYAGLFFRAEGGGSAPFGEIQQANQSWISNVHSVSYHYDSWSGAHATGIQTFSLKPGEWSKNVNPARGMIKSMEMYTTDGETRPLNTAVRFWQRIG